MHYYIVLLFYYVLLLSYDDYKTLRGRRKHKDRQPIELVMYLRHAGYMRHIKYEGTCSDTRSCNNIRAFQARELQGSKMTQST